MKKTHLLSVLLILFINLGLYSQWQQSYNGSGNSNDVTNAVAIDASDNLVTTGYSTGIGSGKDIATIKYSPSGVMLWARVYNGTGNGNDEAYAITIDGMGNIYVTGYSYGNNSEKDIVTIMYNSNGDQQWARRLTSNDDYDDEAYAITIDGSGNIYIAGYMYGDNKGNEMTVVKYNSAGTQLWLSQYNGANGDLNDEAYAITIDGSSNVIITGSSELDSGPNSASSFSDIATVKFNSAGVQQWARRYNANADRDDEAYAITIDGSGNIYITGSATFTGQGKNYVTIKYNSAGTEQWTSIYNNNSANSDDIPSAILIANNSDVIVTGSSKSSTSANSEDYLTIKYNATNGAELFTARYDGAGNSSDKPYAMAVPYSNNVIYVTGSSKQSASSGSEDIVTVAYSPSGNVRKLERIVNQGPDAGLSIKTDSNKDFLIGGYLSGNGTGYDMVSAKYLSTEVIGISKNENTVPDEFKLSQNYPNPFNPTTNIKFDVSKATWVKIVIYDVMGKDVYYPVNEYLQPGSYDASISLNQLSSGMYFYKMTADNFTQVKKMMLVK